MKSVAAKAADWVSMLTASAFVHPVLRWAETSDVRFGLLALGTGAVDVATKLIKIALTSGEHPPRFAVRPAGATDCDMFCRNGPCDGCAGFPSGHAAVITFFFLATAALQESREGLPANRAYWAFAMFAIASVLAARVYKRCHSVLQVLVGASIGALGAWAWRVAVIRSNEDRVRE